MDLSRSAGPALLPESYDVRTLGAVGELFARSSESLEEVLRRSLYWTLRLTLASESVLPVVRATPGFRHLAFGFLDPEFEGDAFGVIIFAARSFQRTERPTESAGAIKVDGYEFPVVVRRILETPHQAVPSPSGGTGACWARSRINANPIGPGILTAKHVVGNVLGVPIMLSCGCTGRLDDVGPDGIDAALVTSSCSRAGRQVMPRQLVAPWMDVYVEGESSGRRHTKVTAVSDTMGILNSASLPARVFLASAGRGGDSGAIVAEARSDDPVGIYMGGYSNPAGQVGGIAQHAYQVTQLMDMELYL